MLRYLRIRNLAVIESVALELAPGLTVLTGETGAGKSILVEAVGLLLGGRAAADLVRTGEDLAEVEALFEDGEREVVIRREVNAQGRSRAFIDGALATAATLREFSARLVELHGQHEHQILSDPETHLDLLDAYAQASQIRLAVAESFTAVQRLRAELDTLRLDERQKSARIDLLTFQRSEIEKVSPREGEDEELAATKRVLANAERLQRLSNEAYASLYEEDGAVLSALTGVWRRVAELAALDPRVAPHLDSRDAIKSQLEDLAFFLREYTNGIDASPARLQEVEDRLAAVERLKRKYGPTLTDVRAHHQQCVRELGDLSQLEARSAEAASALAIASRRFIDAAEALSTHRRRAAQKLATDLETALADLSMAQTRCEVRFGGPVAESSWTSRGVDTVEFLVSPNPGEELRPLARIASGGELSRIMLALRSISADSGRAQTLIFDEVDAGIGGRAADDVGRKLQRLGQDRQVLCITHLPQIAAHGTSHFQVSKQVVAGRTITSVQLLNGPGRIEELARMMAGGVTTPGVLASAGDLLASRHSGSVPPAPKRGECERRKAKGRL
jgi:DNA repair protein RecN (Recombination protein N)